MRLIVPHARALAVAVLILGFAAEVHAAVPGGLLLQRRGRMYIPARPTIIDSSPEIEILNKALKALGETNFDYDGHRAKAIEHISAAIHNIETSKQHGRSNAAVEKAAIGKAAVATKTAATPDAASDESLRKAKAILFTAHHKLVGHTATKGQIKADAQVRVAIDEIVAALKITSSPAKPAAAPAGASTATAKTSANATSAAVKPTK